MPILALLDSSGRAAVGLQGSDKLAAWPAPRRNPDRHAIAPGSYHLANTNGDPERA
jgi:hypothetical protein